MSLIEPAFGLLFWQTVVFLLLIFILKKYGYDVIVKMISDRKDYIDGSLQKAHEANERLANIQKEGEMIMQEARERQAHILKEAAETRDAMIETAKEKAKTESARLLKEAKMEIDAEKQNAIKGIQAQVAELSVLVAEKVLRNELSDESKQMAMISNLLDNVSPSSVK